MTVGEVSAVGVPVLMGVVWLLRLEGRINTNDRVTEMIRNDLAYIRNRIDQVLNGRD